MMFSVCMYVCVSTCMCVCVYAPWTPPKIIRKPHWYWWFQGIFEKFGIKNCKWLQNWKKCGTIKLNIRLWMQGKFANTYSPFFCFATFCFAFISTIKLVIWQKTVLCVTPYSYSNYSSNTLFFPIVSKTNPI